MDPTTYTGPIVVTALVFVLWYVLLLGLQRGTKYRLLAEYAARGEPFDRYFTIEVLALTGLIKFHEGIYERETPKDADFD